MCLILFSVLALSDAPKVFVRFERLFEKRKKTLNQGNQTHSKICSFIVNKFCEKVQQR